MCIIDRTHDMQHKGDGTTKEERLIFKIKHPVFDQMYTFYLLPWIINYCKFWMWCIWRGDGHTFEPIYGVNLLIRSSKTFRHQLFADTTPSEYTLRHT